MSDDTTRPADEVPDWMAELEAAAPEAYLLTLSLPADLWPALARYAAGRDHEETAAELLAQALLYGSPRALAAELERVKATAGEVALELTRLQGGKG